MFQILGIMNDKYPELVQFYRDNENQQQLQKAIMEYQYFAKVYADISYVISCKNASSIEPTVLERLDSEDRNLIQNPRLPLVWTSAQEQIVESIFFHANDLNSEVYSYA